MSDRHEADLASWLPFSRMTPGSGNGFANPTDVRQSRFHTEYAFAVDGKSTLSKSISVTRDMLDKLVEQSHGERPAMALRYYDNERLTSSEDWMLIRMDDFIELLEIALGD